MNQVAHLHIGVKLSIRTDELMDSVMQSEQIHGRGSPGDVTSVYANELLDENKDREALPASCFRFLFPPFWSAPTTHSIHPNSRRNFFFCIIYRSNGRHRGKKQKNKKTRKPEGKIIELAHFSGRRMQCGTLPTRPPSPESSFLLAGLLNIQIFWDWVCVMFVLTLTPAQLFFRLWGSKRSGDKVNNGAMWRPWHPHHHLVSLFPRFSLTIAEYRVACQWPPSTR